MVPKNFEIILKQEYFETFQGMQKGFKVLNQYHKNQSIDQSYVSLSQSLLEDKCKPKYSNVLCAR